jgi:hypothetical protein
MDPIVAAIAAQREQDRARDEKLDALAAKLDRIEKLLVQPASPLEPLDAILGGTKARVRQVLARNPELRKIGVNVGTVGSQRARLLFRRSEVVALLAERKAR